MFKILFSNLGYARGIDGSFNQHIGRLYRHVYTSAAQQRDVLMQFNGILQHESPDLCCLVEIDKGSWQTGYYNQIEALVDENYPVHDIAGKYGEDTLLAQMPFFKGKCNAFLSRTPLQHRKAYFRHGSKRLVYEIALPCGIHVFFAHFSLQAKVRARQFLEMRELVGNYGGDAIILADFNIFEGFGELGPLLKGMKLHVMSSETDHTFMLGDSRWALDLCVCSQNLLPRLSLRIVPQPFSDHAALLVELRE